MMRATAIAGLALALLVSMPAGAAEPAWWTQQKRQCGLAPNLAYNIWVAQGSPCAGAYRPPPDPRAALRNRVQALAAANPGLVDAAAMAQTDLWNDEAFAGLVGRIHHDLWRTYSDSEAVTAGWSRVTGYYAPHLARLEAFASSLDSRRADLVPAQYVDALDHAQGAEAAAQQALAQTRQRVANESLGATFSAALWEDARNRALALLRARLPREAGLPAVTDENGAGAPMDRLHVPAAPFHEPWLGSEPMPLQAAEGVIAPDWNPDGFRQAVPMPEPPLPDTLDDRVSAVESLAAQARAAQSRAAAAAADGRQIEERYRSYLQIAQRAEDAIAQMQTATDLSQRRATWLEAARRNAEVKVRNAVWARVYATGKALVWSTVASRIVPDALAGLAHAGPAEKARKIKALVDQVRSIEGDFELYSAQAARVLAEGSPAEARHLLDAVWGASRADGRETMEKALDAADAPAALGEGWRRLLGDPEP
ncbi:MAG TPA: hypothetical protein VGF77_00920 [Allosphingosinicella sp.]|jgi:hypothetical protein